MERRTAQAEATKQRIREAATEVLINDPSNFTLAAVAGRAETTVQTVLRVFGSKEELAAAALDAGKSRGHRQESPPGDVAAAMRVLYDDYETIGDMVIRQLAEERLSPVVARLVAVGRLTHRRWVETVFAPQIRARAGRRRQALCHALVVATDVYVWKLLRRDLGLGRHAAEAVVVQMIEALVAGG